MEKIIITIKICLLYLFGYRAYNIYAKSKHSSNKIIFFDRVLLKKDSDLYSGYTLADAISQMPFQEIFKSNYTFDHFEPTSIFSYISSVFVFD